MWLVIIIILDEFLHRNIWSKGFGGKSIFTSEVYSVQSGGLPVYYSDHAAIYSWLSLSRTRLTRISGWVEFLSKSRTLLCINLYNLTPVESKFRLSRIKVLVPRCRKPYYLHSLSRIYLSKHVYYLGIKIWYHRWNIQSLTLTFLP
jgi:hypothetical protein